MEFNVEKCKIIHLGKANPKQTYTTGGVEVAETTVDTGESKYEKV